MAHTPLIWIAERSPANAAERNIADLPLTFLQGVLANLSRNDTVAFGHTGSGQAPNYQITRASGARLTFCGRNHRLYPLAELFAEQHLSTGFSHRQVLLSFCLRRDGPSPSSAGRKTRQTTSSPDSSTLHLNCQ